MILSLLLNDALNACPHHKAKTTTKEVKDEVTTKDHQSPEQIPSEDAPTKD